jgi:asparagine synthetase B (glutamine-hydrolysing)
VRRLPPAHALTLHEGRFAVTRYWDPVPPGFAWATADEAGRFEALARQAVRRCLTAGADSIALSGGFDSVGLAALAAEEGAERPPLHAVSLRFADPSCDEGETQVAVARALGMSQTLRDATEMLGGRTLLEAALDMSRESPSPVLSPWQAMYVTLLGSTAPRGLRRLLMGTGGDDVLGVDIVWGADCLAALDLRGLWRFYRSWQRSSPGTARTVARAVLWRGACRTQARRLGRSVLDRSAPALGRCLRRRLLRRARGAWLAPGGTALGRALEDRHLDAPPVPIAPGEGAYVARLRAQLLAPLLLIELDQGSAWAGRAGVRLMLPYFDRDLLDLVMRMHPDHLTVGGYAKGPLRRLVAQRVPVSLPRRKVDFSGMFHALFRSGGGPLWSRMGGARALADLGLVDPGAVDRLMASYFSGGNDALGMRAWLVLSTELWLRARSGDPCLSYPQEGLS